MITSIIHTIKVFMFYSIFNRSGQDQGDILSKISGTGILRDSVKSVPEGVTLDVTVRPGSRSSGLSGFDPWRKRLEIKVKARPVDGSANSELISLLAEVFNIPTANIRIISGERTSSKKILLAGMSIDNAVKKLETEIQ